jgi:hypothetical protein
VKLNLGCGANRLPGYVNVDKHGAPDVRHDLEVFPWPWADGSVEEVVLHHVLEHLGQTPDAFIGVMKELYRVCAPGARVRIVVPHPRHDDFLGDPTHVRVVTPDVLNLFSRRLNLEWQRTGAPNSPLALYHGVDFELIELEEVLENDYLEGYRSGRLTKAELERIISERNNVVREFRLTLKVVKGTPPE